MNRRLHGIAVGTVVAIIVIVTITAFAMYKIFQATSQGYRALTEYAIAAQKPMFKIENFYVNGSNMILRVVNLGPSAAVVRQALVHKYSTSDVPTGVYTNDVNRYIPVGGYFEVPIPLSDLSSFVAYNRPLRLLVDTDRGLVLIGMDAPQSKLVVNVYMPSQYKEDPANWPTLNIQCIGAAVRAPQTIYLAEGSGEDFSVTKKGNTYTVEVNVYGLGKCTVQLKGVIYMPIVAGNKSEWMGLKNSVAGTSTGQMGIKAFLFYHRVDLGQELQYAPSVVVGPTTAATVDIKVPELFLKTCTYNQTGTLICPYPPDQYASSFIIDFSWYFTPVYYVGNLDYADSQAGNTYRYDVYGTALSIVKNGVVVPMSPQGCPVSPHDGDTQAVKDLISKLVYQYTFTDRPNPRDKYAYAMHTGLPIVIYNYPSGCPNIGRTNTILDVAVPFTLPKGKYLVIPIFTYDDRNDQDITAQITVYVTIPGSTSRVETSMSESSQEVVNEFAVPLIVDTPGGDHTLHIVVTNTKSSSNLRADYIAVILSKIVIFKVGGYAGFCTYSVNNPPAFPWVEINVQSGSVAPYGKIVMNPLFMSRYATPSEAQMMTLYYYSPATGIINRSLVSRNGQLFVGNNIVNDARKYYIASNYNINIYVKSRAGSPMGGLVQLLLGLDADTPIAYNPTCIYYGISDVCSYIVPDARPSILSWMPKVYIDYVSLTININFSESGRHYIVIGMYYAADRVFDAGSYLTGGPTIATNKMVDWISPESYPRAYSIALPLQDQYGINYAEAIAVVDVSAGETLTISISNPWPASSYGPTSGYSILVISHIAVVKPPTDIGTIPRIPTSGIPLGIVLRNAKPIDGAYYASATLIRVDNGEVVASWSIDTTTLQGDSPSVLLGIQGFYRLTNTRYTVEKNLHEYPRYVLLVQGLQCSTNTTGSSAGGGSGGGGGGSTSPTPTQIVRTSRGAITYTDFETYPVSGWTNLGGSGFGTTTGHKGNALQFTVGSSGIFGPWAAYYYAQSLTSYSNLWVAGKVYAASTSAYKGIVMLNSNLNALYEVVIYNDQVQIWRFYNGWGSGPLTSTTISSFNPNYWYTIVVNYAVSGNTITIQAWVYDPSGNQVASVIATDSGSQVFIPAYIGVLISAWPGTYAQFDDFIISRTDPRTVTFSNLQSGMSVKIYDNLGTLTHSFTASLSSQSLYVVKDIVLGTGSGGRIEVYDSSGKQIISQTISSSDAFLGGDSYTLQ